jgi:biotin carboxyl carrier protein
VECTPVKVFKVRIKDRQYTVEVGDLSGPVVEVIVDGETVQVELEDGAVAGGAARAHRGPRRTAGIAAAATGTAVRAPMPGRIVRVSVGEGQTVEAGDEVCVLETMKMEQSIRAAQAGVIKAVAVTAGQTVSAGDPLVELE